MRPSLETQFLTIIENDQWLMNLLRKASTLGLKSWAIAAGAVRSSVWDHLHGFKEKVPPSDIDFIFYDSVNVDPRYEAMVEEILCELVPNVKWEAVNQATIHRYNSEEPYPSLEYAISRWAETATAVGVYLNSNGKLRYHAPHGIDDLMNMVFRPHLVTPKSKEVYIHRIATKDFQSKWPRIKIIMP